MMYFAGRGVHQSDALAAQWFKKAAMQGHSAAHLGSMCATGRGVTKVAALRDCPVRPQLVDRFRA
ncbi:hypothetical protein BZM27_42310 [Paraburkholderia steynii]|uniref:Sel1 repeat family protein n=1 Tax=Paraburkholderia steynii TaxID=1245441 RepID=A0A4R0X326_9BURK|nr:hypothetical protein BZM27_42310 [Paraburkholderia steynii]